LQSQYIFVVNNMGFYHSTSQIHGFNTRRNFYLYRPHTNFSTSHKGLHYFGIKLFNRLPLNIKELSYNAKQFRTALSAFLCSKSFYTLDEYFNQGQYLVSYDLNYYLIGYRSNTVLLLYIYCNVINLCDAFGSLLHRYMLALMTTC
jgi:hypothetical protein